MTEVYASSGCRLGGAFSPIAGLIILGTRPIGLSDVPYVQGNTQLDVQYELNGLGFGVWMKKIGIIWGSYWRYYFKRSGLCGEPSGAR